MSKVKKGFGDLLVYVSMILAVSLFASTASFMYQEDMSFKQAIEASVYKAAKTFHISKE